MTYLKAILADIRQGENIEVYAIFIISIIVLVLDVFGTVELETLMEVILAVLALLAVNTLATRSRLKRIRQTIADLPNQIIDALGGVEWREFADTRAFLEYVNGRLKDPTTKSVCDLSWSSLITFDDRDPHVRQAAIDYWDVAGQLAYKQVYKEVFMFNRRGRQDKLRRRIREEQADLYFCGYYPETTVPLLQFMIVNDEEVIFFNGRYPSLAIKHPRLVDLFRQYYDDIWAGSTKLRDETRAYEERIDEVLKKELN